MPDELPKVVRRLEGLGVKYAFTGSLASTVWGQPRATFDADVLIELHASDLTRLAVAFAAPEWYFDEEMAREALAHGGEFNVIHAASGSKIDFWLRSDRPADRMRMARRRRAALAGLECWLLSPEDTILAKLEWIRLAPSDRQRGDVRGILQTQGAALDQPYLSEWADKLGVYDLLRECDDAKHRE